MLKSALFQRYLPTEYQSFLNYDMMKPLQPGMKPTVLCDNLRAALPAHVCVDNYFFRNRFLLLPPPSTRAQCLATKLTDINKLAAFTDRVHTTNASTLVTIKEKPDDLVCATTQIRWPSPSASTLLPDLACTGSLLQGGRMSKVPFVQQDSVPTML